MARIAVEVRSCDRCGSESAHTWVIVGPDGLAREIELCNSHGAPVANAYALARPVVARPAKRGRERAAAPRPPAPAPAPVREPEPNWR